MERFRSHLERRGNSEFSPERVARISQEILESREILSYLLAKIQEALEFKERISSDDGTNTPATWKRLGMFIVHEKKLPQSLVSILQRNGVDIYEDEVLELHIPPQEGSFERLENSFKRLKEYLEANRKERHIPKYIYGVSYLADVAKALKFKIIDLPPDIQERTGAAQVLRDYAAATTDPKKQRIAQKFAIEDIKLCYMSVEDLMETR